MRALLLVLSLLPQQSLSRQANLLVNGDAESGMTAWWASPSDAAVEECGARNHCLVVRNRAMFAQTIRMPAAAVGKVLVVIGFVQADRVDPAAGISDRPHLYGILWNSQKRVAAYLKGDPSRGHIHTAATSTEWQRVWLMQRVEPDSVELALTFSLGERKGSPHDGSAGRFDDLGVFIFNTEEDARAFVNSYKGSR